jgi:3-oxoacyl-(acyl-carrier-protein) synthase
MREHGLESHWEFVFDSAKQRAGLCNYSDHKISLSKYIVEYHSIDQSEQVILHEIAHALAGKSGISTIERQNTENWPVTFAGEVKKFSLNPTLMELKDQDRFDLFNQYALHAGSEAINQAGLTEAGYEAGKIGVIFGTGLGGFPHIEKNHQIFCSKKYCGKFL